MLFDTHCHLNIDPLDKNIDEIIQKANDVGVDYLLIPGTTIETSIKAVKIASKYKNVFAAVGIHPTDEKKLQNPKSLKLQEFDSLVNNSKVVAIGEIGLDYFKIKSEEEKIFQKEIFIKQLEFAKNNKKSVIIHCREASNDIIAILNEYWDDYFFGRMVFHCCEANINLLNMAKQKNICMGFDGDITYKTDKHDFIKEIPLDLLVLETDAPFLTPEPIRLTEKFPNKPENLSVISKFVSNLLKIEKEELEKKVFENSSRLFNIKIF